MPYDLIGTVTFAERQLAEARRRGLEAYDPDRLLITRAPRVNER